MSAPEAKLSYDMTVVKRQPKMQRLYQLFLRLGNLGKLKADGIVVGATFPKIIKYCKKQVGKKFTNLFTWCWNTRWKRSKRSYFFRN